MSTTLWYYLTMADVRWLDERESRAWHALQLMNLQVDGELARRLTADSDLTYTDYTVLVTLTAQPDGRVRLFELCELLGWEKSRLSHQVKRMVTRRLVVKEPCEEDRRGAIVVVTDHGRREIEAAAPGHVAAVRELVVDRLTEQQLDALADVAAAVLAAFDIDTDIDI